MTPTSNPHPFLHLKNTPTTVNPGRHGPDGSLRPPHAGGGHVSCLAVRTRGLFFCFASLRAVFFLLCFAYFFYTSIHRLIDRLLSPLFSFHLLILSIKLATKTHHDHDHPPTLTSNLHHPPPPHTDIQPSSSTNHPGGRNIASTWPFSSCTPRATPSATPPSSAWCVRAFGASI